MTVAKAETSTKPKPEAMVPNTSTPKTAPTPPSNPGKATMPPSPPSTPSPIHQIEKRYEQIEELAQRGKFGPAIKEAYKLGEQHPTAQREINQLKTELLRRWSISSSPPRQEDTNVLRDLLNENNPGVSPILKRGANRYPQDEAWLRLAAEDGDTDSQIRLAHRLANRPETRTEAVQWFQRASDFSSDAAYCYGECLLLGKGISPDPTEATRVLRFAADAGDHRAMDLLGVCLVRGQGTEKNIDEAVDWFELAVSKGNPGAHYNLGARYAQGQGVAKSPSKAAELFQTGADLGSGVCMLSWAKCLEAGFGVSKNYEKAVQWYQKAAKEGLPDAMTWCKNRNVHFVRS